MEHVFHSRSNLKKGPPMTLAFKPTPEQVAVLRKSRL